MAIVGTIVFFTLMAGLFNGLSHEENNFMKPDGYKRLFCALVTVLWIALSGLRHVSVGDDTYQYMRSFLAAQQTSWQELWDVFSDKFFRGIFSKDPGYALLQKAFSMVSGSYQLFLVFIAFIFFVPMGIWIYKRSRIPYISFLLFSCLFYSFFAITGIRQTIATALVVFVGDDLIRERKLGKFLLLTALAMTIHASCLCYLVAYFVWPMKNYKVVNYFWFSIIGIVLILTVANPLWVWIAELLHYTNFLDNEIGGTTFFGTIYLMVFYLAVWRMPVVIRERPDAYGIYNILFVGTLMIVMAMANQSFMRVQQYFTLYLMLMLPEMVLSFRGKDRIVVSFAGCGLLFVLFARNTPYYQFFWQ